MKPTILITGITKGIGRAIAELFAKNGYNIAGCARDKKALDAFKAELWNKYPEQKFLFALCDVSDKNDVLAFAYDVTDEFERIDILVNNAGVFIPGSLLHEEDGIFEQQMNTNLASAYHLSRVIAPKMIAQKSGHIFNICSTASIKAYSNGASYCISKHAMLGFSKGLREELMPTGVRVTAVLPGATLTHSWAGTDHPEERFIKAEDIAQSIWDIHKLSANADVEEILIRPQLGDFA